MPDTQRAHRLDLAGLVLGSAALLAVRLVAAARVGFGDSEALYASYALHPQPAYLDHPGLIGVVARAIGGGTAPSPWQAHAATAGLATLVPWAMVLACRACGATWRRAVAAGIVFGLVPEIAIGTFAMTPDLLVALSWTLALGAAALALGAAPGSARALIGFAAAGTLAGAAAASKVSGVLLLASLGLAYASRAARPHARTIAPWAGLATGAVVVAPVLWFEALSGWPMLQHRLVETQAGAALSARNAAALLGGQLAYLSPLMVLVAAHAARAAWLGRSGAIGSLLWVSSVLPAAALVPLCLWSPIAEPHWIAPALLGLVPALARADAALPRRLIAASTALAAAIVAAVHAWVLLPDALRLAPPSYDARLDLANELQGWPEVISAVRTEADSQWTPGSTRGDVAVVGPHWVICAQLEAGLRGELPVGCNTPIRDDFDGWWPRARWRAADAIVWVTDTRFGPPPDIPAYAVLRARAVRIERAGRLVRAFTIAVLTRRAQG